MRAIHSWSGLLFGWLLFAIFLTGTLAVFDNEITQWMQPEVLELSLPRSDVGRVGPLLTGLTAYPAYGELLSSPAASIRTVKLQTNRTFSGQTIDPQTGKMVILRDTQGGDFFYHFHHGLLAGVAGAWIVGTAGMVMLVALVTGLGIHRLSVKDLVVVRFWSVPQRAWLYWHNLVGTLAFPFTFMITVTGLMISWSIYMPTELQFLSDRGWVLPLLSTLHVVRFGGAAMRWLYFLMGLTTSIMIATGLVLWTIKRRNVPIERSGVARDRVIDSLTVAAVAGFVVSLAAFFWINRLLPLALIERSFWEIRCVFVVWCVSVLHSLLRGGSLFAWKDQLYVAALLLGCLPLLNALTTNSHLLRTIPQGQWAVAGVDLTAMASGLLLGWIARRLGKAGLECPSAKEVEHWPVRP